VCTASNQHPAVVELQQPSALRRSAQGHQVQPTALKDLATWQAQLTTGVFLVIKDFFNFIFTCQPT